MTTEAPDPPHVSISVLILTFNEAVNIGECISSVPWRKDVHVLDSCSNDNTLEIAAQHRANTHVRPFSDYAEQRNFGFSLPFANDWIVCLDADERMTPELAVEIELKIRTAGSQLAMICVRRKDIFMNRWLRRSSGYPTWFPRIFRRGRIYVKRRVNEEYEPLGETTYLQGHLLHYPFNKGIEWWIDRHNRYSMLEARLMAEHRLDLTTLVNLVSRDGLSRRRALKCLAYNLPARPWLVFFYLYIVRFGFIDGVAGYRYAELRLAYEIMIDAKLAVLRLGDQGV